MDIDVQKVVAAYQAKLSEITTQLVMTTALAEQLKEELEAQADEGE